MLLVRKSMNVVFWEPGTYSTDNACVFLFYFSSVIYFPFFPVYILFSIYFLSAMLSWLFFQYLFSAVCHFVSFCVLYDFKLYVFKSSLCNLM